MIYRRFRPMNRASPMPSRRFRSGTELALTLRVMNRPPLKPGRNNKVEDLHGPGPGSTPQAASCADTATSAGASAAATLRARVRAGDGRSARQQSFSRRGRGRRREDRARRFCVLHSVGTRRPFDYARTSRARQRSRGTLQLREPVLRFGRLGRHGERSHRLERAGAEPPAASAQPAHAAADGRAGPCAHASGGRCAGR